MLWHAFLLGGLAASLALATLSPSDILSDAWHASNITGLSDLYAWVGSYYNGTTTVEVIPLLGQSANDPVCQNVRGRIFHATFESFLAVTERASYNIGHNPINMLLSLWKPGTDFSAFTNDTNMYKPDLWTEPSLQWCLDASPWTSPAGKGGSWNDLSEDPPLRDIFNLTLSPTTHAPYNMTARIGRLANPLALDQMYLDLDVCDSRKETKNSLVTILAWPWTESSSWNWTYPIVNLGFDSQTAHLSLDGSFTAIPMLLPNSSRNPRIPNLGNVSFQGSIKIRFQGIIDPYHSDVLVNDSATPTWLRTVGYGNNSANIGSKSKAEGRPGLALWSVAFQGLLVIFLLSITFVY